MMTMNKRRVIFLPDTLRDCNVHDLAERFMSYSKYDLSRKNSWIFKASIGEESLKEKIKELETIDPSLPIFSDIFVLKRSNLYGTNVPYYNLFLFPLLKTGEDHE